MKPRVSLIMIVRNEERNLADCLDSVKELFDEIVVVDTGSTDGTRAIATHFGARVFDFPWIDDFSAARNEALRHAHGDWIFWLDADDRVDEVNRRKLQTLFASLGQETIAYQVKVVSQSAGETGTATVLDQLRLFPRHPDVAWRGRIHEQIWPALERIGAKIQAADVIVQHVGYRDAAERRRKLARDLNLLQIEVAAHPFDALMLFHLGWTWHLLGDARQALPILYRCLQSATPEQAIVRKAYILVVRCLRQLGERQQALSYCGTARARYPDDAELCFHEGQMRKELGDFAGAEACLRGLFSPVASAAASIGEDMGLRGPKGRCALAEVYRDGGKPEQAEEQYRLALAEQPDLTVAWMCLLDSLLQRGADTEAVIEQAASVRDGALTAKLLEARVHLFRKNYLRARELAEQAVAQAPGALWPREILSHVLVLEGRDWRAAERAVRDVLAMQPSNPTALHNLAFVQRQLARVP